MRTETHKLEDGYRSVYTYDDAGLNVRTTDYDAEGNLTFDIHYEHNESGDVIGWKVYGREGRLIRRFEVVYDSHGLESETREYEENDRLISRKLSMHDSENRPS
jgi:hypothetical protein